MTISMTLRSRLPVLLVAATLAVSACAPGSQPSAGGQPTQADLSNRTLAIGINVEPTTLAGRPPTTSGSTPNAPMQIFDAWLAAVDGHNVPRPQLAEKLPELNTANWQVFPDGTMQTTYRLKRGVTWHDGTPLTAQDFVFGYQVWTWKDMGSTIEVPISLMKDVSAPDDQTVVVRWGQTYPDAGALGVAKNGGLPPMPGHLLESKFKAGDAQAFLNDPYWTTGFVGSGPYKLDRWEPGAFIQASAFANFVEGRPKINLIKLVFTGDANTAVASLLAGEIHVVGDGAIGFEQGSLLKRQWESTGAGVVLLTPNKARYVGIQFKPDYVNPKAILDLRVRKAFLEATDRPSLSAGILDGQAAAADTLAGPNEEFFAELDRVNAKYPYNVQDAASLMSEAGFSRGSDGFYADASGQRLSLEARTFAVDPGPRELAILADQWKQFGADINTYVIPNALAQDPEQVSLYPAFRIDQTGVSGSGGPTAKFISANIGTAEKKWTGINRGGWSNSDYDRLIDTFVTSLDRNARNQAVVEALKILSVELPTLPLYYLSLATAYTSALRGPLPGYTNDTAWDNVWQWEWVR